MEELTPDIASVPESITIHLPSALEPELRAKLCSNVIVELEDRLRLAQASESLSNLRSSLLTRSVAYVHTSRHIPSQGLYTRQQALQQQIEARVKTAAEDYRAARQSLLSLRGLGDWSQSLKELKPEDIRGINERLLREEEKDIYCQSQKLAGVSEKKIKELLSGHGENIITVDEAPNLLSKRQPPSWIWYIGVIGDLDNAKAIESSLRVEWCKARACADRSREEIELLEEEMRRAIDFCIWRARWWKDQVGRRQGVSRHLAEGLRAYAMEQSELEMTQATTWSATWSPLRQRLVTITSALKEDHDLDAMLQQLGTLTVELDLDPEDDVQGVDDDVE